MLHVLLVDDEPYVVEDLHVTIDWKSLDIEHVHIAYSGFEALEIIKKYPIDIVVSDINMPQMTGLELIKNIKQNWKHIKCILLTGYADFEYAKQAINQNVSDYLLKPISDEDFINTLKRIQLEIQHEWEHISSYQKTIQTLNEHMPLLRDKFLNDILLGRFTNKAHFENRAQQLHIPFKIGDPIAFLITRLEHYYQQHDIHSLLLFEYAIINVTVELLEPYFHVWTCKDTHDYLIFMVTPKNNESYRFENEFMQNIAYQVQKNVASIIGGEISIVTTNWGTFLEQARQLYDSAINTMHQNIGFDTGVYLSTLQTSVVDNSIPIIQSLYDSPSIAHLLETGQWETLNEKIENVIDELKSNKRCSQEHFDEVKHLLHALFLNYIHRNNKLLSEILDANAVNSKTIRQADQLKEWAQYVLSCIKLYFDKERIDKRSSIISKIKDYIKDNLNYVSLHAIADHVNLHPVYLSKLFKEETGQKISDYIFFAKMEVANDLLLHSDLKIYQISEQLGYSNAHYFIKVFKDYSGATPQEYRENKN